MKLDVIYNEDCLEGMKKRLSADSIDLVKTDPPYGISSEVKITRGRNKMKFKGPDISHYFGKWDTFKNSSDFWFFTFAWVDETVRVLRKGGMFCSYFDRDKINFLSKYLSDHHNFKHKDYYADCKSNPVPQARKVKWMSGWEEIGLWQKPDGKLTYNYQLGQRKNYGIRPIVGGRKRFNHPTQKPLSVITDFIAYWSNENDIVLDPFMGSGTTAVVCRKLGRHYIGFEINPEYCEIAKKRLSEVQLELI